MHAALINPPLDIVAAAIKDRLTEEVFSLPPPVRHHDIIHYMIHEKGYPKPITGYQGDNSFSEDLW